MRILPPPGDSAGRWALRLIGAVAATSLFLFGIAVISTLVTPSHADNKRPDILGSQSGCKVITTLSTSWVAYTSNSLQNEAQAIGYPVSSGMVWAEVYIRNDEASGGNTIYIDTYAAGVAGDATTDRRTLPPGAYFSNPSFGEKPTTVRLRGSGAGTDALLCGKFLPRGN